MTELDIHDHCFCDRCGGRCDKPCEVILDPIPHTAARGGLGLDEFYRGLLRARTGGGECIRCGECCRRPCDLIPSDLPALLSLTGMGLRELFDTRLMAFPIVSGPWEVLPVLMLAPSLRSPRAGKPFLATRSFYHEFMPGAGPCVFYDEGLPGCAIYEARPYGAKALVCARTAPDRRGLAPEKNIYYEYWRLNQHLFELIRPGYLAACREMENAAREYYAAYRKSPAGSGDQFERQAARIGDLFAAKVHPLFGEIPDQTVYVWDERGMRPFLNGDRFI